MTVVFHISLANAGDGMTQIEHLITKGNRGKHKPETVVMWVGILVLFFTNRWGGGGNVDSIKVSFTIFENSYFLQNSVLLRALVAEVAGCDMKVVQASSQLWLSFIVI